MKRIILTWGLAVLINGFKLKYYDCSQPKSIHRYNLKTYCTNHKSDSNVIKEYKILQQMKQRTMTGFSCKIYKSSFTMHCGMFSHEEILKVPDIEIQQPIDIQDCHSMVNGRHWTSREGTSHRIKLGENVIQLLDKGTIYNNDNKMACEGEKVKLGSQLVDGVVVMSQYRVLLLKQDYVVSNDRVEVVSSHTALPPTCQPVNGGCVADSTYVWQAPLSTCNLEVINQGRFVEEGDWLIDHHQKLLFKISSLSAAPRGCPRSARIYLTEYDDLYLTPSREFQEASSTKVDITLFIRQAADYVLYQAEHRASAVLTTMTETICGATGPPTKEELFPMAPPIYGKRSGEVLYTFSCEQKEGPILPGKQCYNKVPMQDGTFVDLYLKVKTPHATKVICNVQFPTQIEALEGWLSLPQLVPCKAPSSFRRLSNSSHEDMSHGGLYTQSQLDDWGLLVHYGDFHEAALTSVTTGACINENVCSKDNTLARYDLNKLLHTPELEWTAWASFKSWVTEYGAILSAAVLLIWAIKAILWVGLLLSATIKEGRPVAAALFYMLCCGPLYKMGRLRNKRRATPSAPNLPVEEQVPLKPV